MTYFLDTPENRNFVIQSLKQGKMVLHITKADDSYRAIVATLSSELVPPPSPATADAKERVMSPNSQVVWDLDINEWRSFRWDRLHNFSEYVTPETIGLR